MSDQSTPLVLRQPSPMQSATQRINIPPPSPQPAADDPCSPSSPPSSSSLTQYRDWLLSLSPTSLLLVFVPTAIVLQYLTSSPIAQFVTSCLGIVPLAGLMGDATENISDHLGPNIGGLMNASFGNAAELILALFGCFRQLDDLVKASLCGSIIGNILLVLGMSILTGGLRYKQQRFSVHAAHSEATMAVAAAVAFLVPAIFHSIITTGGEDSTSVDENRLSLGIGVLLLVTYALMLFFQLRTHAAWFNDNEGAGADAAPLTLRRFSLNRPSQLRQLQQARQDKEAETVEAASAAADDQTDEDAAEAQDGVASLESGAVPQSTALLSPKRHRTLHSLIAWDPEGVSLMTKKTYARKIVREGQEKERREKERLERETHRQPSAEPGTGGSSARVAPIIVNSFSPVQRNKTKQSWEEEKTADHTATPSPAATPTQPLQSEHPFASHGGSHTAALEAAGQSPSGGEATGPNGLHLSLPMSAQSPSATARALPAEPLPPPLLSPPPASLQRSVLTLCVSCGLVAWLSEVLTGSATAAGSELGLSSSFLGIIVVAIIGNAAEHSTAVQAALHNNMNIALSIAFGSALQIAMFVCPVVVFSSYGRSGPPMNLIVGELEVFAVSVSCVVSWMVVNAGGSDWLQGLMMCMIYLIIALAFYFLPVAYS